MRSSRPIMLAALAGACLAANPASAQVFYPLQPFGGMGSYQTYGGSWDETPVTVQHYPAPQAMNYPVQQGLPPQPGARQLGYGDAEREAWLKECRKNAGDNGLGGALIGGVVGGIAGNRIAGSGNRTIGTIAGAAVGAVAGAAIDKGEDAGRVRDECEAYLERYEANASAGYANGGAYYGQGGYHASCGQPCGGGCAGGCGGGCGYTAMPVMWVPVMVAPQVAHVAKPMKKKEKIVRTIVTEEWVEDEVVVYEKVPTKVVKTKLVPVKTGKAQPAPAKGKLVPAKPRPAKGS
jgi:hypothetical protein